ncbi:MAG: winged helix-turn-helix transcriptional regulator [Herpetosiphon sp.]|nr:winged helix-turn-helix transcriptional regulator [Herpetosiphon sp.]
MTVLAFREGTPAGDILLFIQKYGSATIKELEEALGVSTTAVREQVTHLTNQGWIAPSKIRQGAGRPLFRYTLTAKAQGLFPKGYDVLLNLLLEEILEHDGAEKLQSLLTNVGKRLATLNTPNQPFRDALRERLMDFVYTMNKKGVKFNLEQLQDGSWIVSEYACPYFEVAQSHDSVCSMERKMMETALGHKVELSQRIVEGHTGCHFVVTPNEEIKNQKSEIKS